MKVEDYMTPVPTGVPRSTTVREAIAKMIELRIRHLLVMDGDQMIGLLSQRELDVLTTLSAIDIDRANVELAMTPDPFHVETDTPLEEVATQMAEARVGSVVVTSKSGEAVGIFTTVDALRALADVLRGKET